MHRGITHPLRLWIPAGSLPEKLGNWVMSEEGRRVGPWQTLTQLVSGLVGKMGCVRGQALVRRSRVEQEDFVQKKALTGCLGNSTAVSAPNSLATPQPPPPHAPTSTPMVRPHSRPRSRQAGQAGSLGGRRRHLQQRRAAGLRELAVPRKT